MVPQNQHTMNFLIYAFVLGCLTRHGHAGFSLSDIQPIVGFSDECASAYDTKITQCKGNKLAPLSDEPSCSNDCHDELQDLTTSIQSACRGNGANPDTIVGHAFIGDLADFMCAEGNFAAEPLPAISTGSATNALSSTSSSSSTSASDVSSTTDSSTISTTAESSSTTTSSSPSSSTTLTPSTTAQPSSSSTSETEAPRSTSDGSSTSDSTPFDQSVGANTATSLSRCSGTIGECLANFWWLLVVPLILVEV